MTMEFLRPNFITTETQIVVDSANTLTVENLISVSRKTLFETVGYSSDTSTIISVEFDTATTINRILLLNHNLKQFRVFYNSSTSNTFSPDANVSSNSETAHYFSFTDQTVNSVQIQLDSAQTSDTEKKIGRLIISTQLLNFERNPSSQDYRREIDREQIVHNMPNGGVSVFNIDDKFNATIKWKFLTESFTSQLFDIYNTGTTVEFVPFGTSSSWDGDSFECAWIGKFDFRHSANNFDAGFSGQINLREVS